VKRAILAAVLGLALAAPAAEASPYGFSDSVAGWNSAFDAGVRSGATEARVLVGHDSTNEPELAAFYQRAVAAGITPTITLWMLRPPPVEDFANDAANAARLYPEAKIQLLNEPNLPNMGGGLSAEQSAEYVRAGYDAIARVNPLQRVLGPSVAPVGDGWVGYLHDVYDRLEDLPIGLALNVYPYGKDPIDAMKFAYRAAKVHGLPITVTETALVRNVYGKRAPKLTVKVLRWWSAHRAEAVLFHRLLQEEGDRLDEAGWHTYAIASNGQKTDLYRAIRNARPR